MAQCKDCKWKPGLDDENTLCQTCKGSGLAPEKAVPSVPKTKAKKGKK